ncbi:MAG: 23S rRNA pseudouridine1911/1915/1917 synthase [Myxococcota bacterium]|jgi:23S rRNA pseudouridine1911/1915/1917 synthase
MGPSDIDARIVLERDGLLVMDKPSGMPTSGRRLTDTDCLQYWLMQRHGGMVWAVHQLDADTTGINLFVTEKHLVSHYHERLGHQETRKEYLAMVHGAPDWDERAVDAPIGMLDMQNLGVTASGRTAFSTFRVLSRGPQSALVVARIRTGRTHQIRIHLSHLGHPVIGEEWYRDAPCTRHPRQALHAWRLDMDGLNVSIPPASDLVALAESEGLSLEAVVQRSRGA